MAMSTETQLFGRDEVILQLVGVLEQVERNGVAVGLTGEPGMGKTLVQAHVSELARAAGFAVLSARGSQRETHLPYANLHQLLTPILATVDELPPRQRDSLLACFGAVEVEEVNPFFTSLGVLELIVRTANDKPVLISLDDLHWMDQPTLDTLAFVARRIEPERVVLLCTSRSQEPLLGDDQTMTWIELEGLSSETAETLLRSRSPELATPLRERVIAESGGNPLALVEFVKALQTGTYAWSELDRALPMTDRLERAFTARADTLGPAARAVVDVAALDDGDDIRQLVTAASLLAGSTVGVDAVSGAVELGLLTVDGSTYALSHPLMGSAVRRAMTQGRRMEGHAALATTLAAFPERALWHRAGAVSGRDESIAAELERAADSARRRGAFATALARLERSAALSPDPQDQASRLLSAAELGYELGRFGHVEQIKSRVLRMTLRPRDRSRLTWLEGAFHDGATSEPADVRHLVRLARTANDDDDTDLAMQLLFGAARRVWWRDPGESVRHEIIGAAREVPLRSDDPRLLAVFGLAESLELSAAVLAQLDHWPVDLGGRLELAAPLGIAAFCSGDFVRADSFLTLAINQLRGEGRLSLLAEALAIRAWAEINLGVFDAGRSADEGMRLSTETGQKVWAGTAGLALAVIDAVAGRWQGRHWSLVKAEQIALQLPNASSSLLAGAQLARGIAELGSNRPEPAYGELVRVFRPSDPAHQRVQQLWTISYLAEAAVSTNRREHARPLLAAVEELTAGSSAVGAEIALEYTRAVLSDDDTAEGLFLAAMAGAGSPFPWHQARTQLAYGSWLRRQRRVTESREPLRAARTAFDALGTKPWALRADHELRATGERGWEPAPNSLEELSPQEAQIAQLASQGLSNREIAQRLFLSHRTVGSHLYRIFPKLGITSRQQLAEILIGATAVDAVLNHPQSSD
ncbi:ATP-binding protein [Pedococcus bigeumensis]|nr:LuxR family transcriptional regulator [Pedococcus bigeumensis]